MLVITNDKNQLKLKHSIIYLENKRKLKIMLRRS